MFEIINCKLPRPAFSATFFLRFTPLPLLVDATAIDSLSRSSSKMSRPSSTYPLPSLVTKLLSKNTNLLRPTVIHDPVVVLTSQHLLRVLLLINCLIHILNFLNFVLTPESIFQLLKLLKSLRFVRRVPLLPLGPPLLCDDPILTT
jgi:hypothetical protein